ncbi:putative Mediator of RNA polymerase II transcription subunit 18 [Diplocarpon rosae]|nr:putative Mediator of RNA polymerase II transcription subunit 18 [Diplocarpon rosae]
MHELFLTTYVYEGDLNTTEKILQGYCASHPKTILFRKLIWEGPRTRTPKPIDVKFIKAQPQQVMMSWKFLSDQLSRQSYILNTLYEVDESSFGQAENGIMSDTNNPPREGYYLDQRPGTLRWNDLPDPTAAKPVNSRLPDPGLTRPVNSRLIVSIENQGNLCSIMRMLNHRHVTKIPVFELTRYLEFPASEGEPVGKIRSQLPAFSTLLPFDSENKWILTASVLVAKGDDPQQMKKGMDQLVAIKTDFEGCFDFKAMDRHIFDTRVKI